MHLSLSLIDEVQKLCDEGYGTIVTKEKMVQDQLLPYNQCCSVYLKPSPEMVDRKLLKMANDEDMTMTFYSANFNKTVQDENIRRIIWKYHPHIDTFYISPLEEESQDSAFGM